MPTYNPFPQKKRAQPRPATRVQGSERAATAVLADTPDAANEQDRLMVALDASGLGTWEWNIHTGRLVWSDRLKALFGLAPSHAISYDEFTQRVHADDREPMQQIINEAIRSGSTYQIEFRAIWPDGSVHWLMGRGKALVREGETYMIVGTTMDITKRKGYQQELEESEERFRSMADSAPVMIWQSDLDAQLVYFNEPWLKFRGRSLDEESGDGWTEGILRQDHDHCLQLYHTNFEKRKPFSMEMRFQRADGQYRWVLVNGAPRFAADGEFMGYIGSCIDIDDVKRTIKRKHELEEITENLTRQRSQLVALNNAKEEFISIASHQLRTPATVVKQYVGMLVQGYVGELTPTQRRMLKAAYESNERQLKIVEDLLRVAHVDAGRVRLEKAWCDVTSLLKNIIVEQNPKFVTRNQTLESHLPSDKLMLVADEKMIRMVFENIIDNASKYTPAGKTVSVSATATDECVEVRIKDSGVGIADEDIGKLFHKFARIDNPLTSSVTGSGLGLYWAKQIVDLHEGTIAVKSKLDAGTEFMIRLPTNLGES